MIALKFNRLERWAQATWKTVCNKTDTWCHFFRHFWRDQRLCRSGI